MLNDTEYYHMIAVENALEKTNLLLAEIISILKESPGKLEFKTYDPSSNTYRSL